MRRVVCCRWWLCCRLQLLHEAFHTFVVGESHPHLCKHVFAALVEDVVRDHLEERYVDGFRCVVVPAHRAQQTNHGLLPQPLVEPHAQRLEKAHAAFLLGVHLDKDVGRFRHVES